MLALTAFTTAFKAPNAGLRASVASLRASRCYMSTYATFKTSKVCNLPEARIATPSIPCCFAPLRRLSTKNVNETLVAGAVIVG